MEEMLYKFIDEGKRKQEEMRAFICDFQTTNELLFKERNNSLIELRFGAQELLKVMNNARMIDYEVKGVTTCCPSYRILLVGSHFYRSNSLSLGILDGVKGISFDLARRTAEMPWEASGSAGDEVCVLEPFSFPTDSFRLYLQHVVQTLSLNLPIESNLNPPLVL
ncbi:hypothetical protein Tco_0025573 [Tanacetum coccineum]